MNQLHLGKFYKMLKLKDASEVCDNHLSGWASGSSKEICSPNAVVTIAVCDVKEKVQGECRNLADDDEFHSCDESDTTSGNEGDKAEVSACCQFEEIHKFLPSKYLAGTEKVDSSSTVSAIKYPTVNAANAPSRSISSKDNPNTVCIVGSKLEGGDMNINSMLIDEANKSHKIDCGILTAGSVAVPSAFPHYGSFRERPNAEYKAAEISNFLVHKNCPDTESDCHSESLISISPMAPSIGKTEKVFYDLHNPPTNCFNGNVCNSDMDLPTGGDLGSSQCSHIVSNSDYSRPSSPCDSPGVFFSCFTSLSDIRDESVLLGKKNAEPKLSQVETRPLLREAKDINHQGQFDTRDNKFQQQPPVFCGNRKTSGFQRTRHPRSRRRKENPNNKDKPDSGRSVSLLAPENSKTKMNPSVTKSATPVDALNNNTSASLSARRDVFRSLAPLAIVQQPQTRRTKSASPIPSRIPRPIVREKATLQTPSDPTKHSKGSRATASRSVSLCSERDTHFRRWSRLQSSPKCSSQSEQTTGRPKFTSGKGGTAWTVPAFTGHVHRDVTESDAGCSSSYTKNTFSSTSKRRNKVPGGPSLPIVELMSRKRNLPPNFNKKLQIASNVHNPTPPSSCPPLSPVSFPSVGSSPIVLVNQISDENFFFPKTVIAASSQKTQAVSLKANKESENHALKISGRISETSVLDAADVNTTEDKLPSEVAAIQSYLSVQHNISFTYQNREKLSSWKTLDTHDGSFNISSPPYSLPDCSDNVQPYSLDYVDSNQSQTYSLDSLATSLQLGSPDSAIRNSDQLESNPNRANSVSYHSTPCEVHQALGIHNVYHGKTSSHNEVTLSESDTHGAKSVTDHTPTLKHSANLCWTPIPDEVIKSECGRPKNFSDHTSTVEAFQTLNDRNEAFGSNEVNHFESAKANTRSFTGRAPPSKVPFSPRDSTYYGSTSPREEVNQTSGDSPYSSGTWLCQGDSTYGSLPYTLDSLTDYPSCASPLPLSFVSTTLGKEGEMNTAIDVHHSESEDSLEEYAWIHMSGGGELHTRLNALNKRNILQAKLRASLAWLLSKVYGPDVPREMHDPFYENSQGQLALRPVLVNMMSSSELYCHACANMFPETHAQWSGHWSIIQVLSRKGIYVADTPESAVTETVLVQTAPFKLKAHLALIDALMRAYMCEVASVEKVVKAVRNFTTFPASSELPSSPEEALKFWINKVCALITKNGVGACHKEKQLLEGDAGQKVLVTTSGNIGSRSEPVNVPLLDDLMSDVGDGSSVAALIAYYKPSLLDIKSVCLKDSIGIADSLYNLRLIGQFCRAHLPFRRFHLSYEDLLYTHASMRVNICTFLADLFFCFEGPSGGQRNPAANAIKTAKEKLDAMPAAGKRSALNTPSSAASVVSPVPISNATKKSFQHRGSLEDSAGNLGLTGRSTTPGSLPGQHQPLLPRRSGGRRSFAQDDGSGVGGLMSSGGVMTSSPPTSRRGRRTVSLCSPQDRDIVQRSVLAWQDDQSVASGQNRVDRPGSRDGRSGGNLLANVSIDSNLDCSLNTDTSLSLNLALVDTPRTGRHSALDPGHPDYMEIESVNSGQPSRFASPHSASSHPTGRLTAGSELMDNGDQASLEPLMPAVLKPTKERDALLSKAQERGDRTPRRKKVSSPSEPTPHMVQQQQQQQQQLTATGDELAMSLSASSSATTVSPLPGDEGSDHFSQVYAGQPYGEESLDVAGELPNSARSNAAFSVAESYTLQDRPSTAHEARAAGIPIVSDSVASGSTPAGHPNCSREGSVASSGDYSDHESHKIHQDHKLRESGHQGKPSRSLTDQGSESAQTSARPGLDTSDKPAVALISDQLVNSSGSSNNNNSSNNNSVFSALKASPGSNTTNFAELKRLKDNLEFNIDKVDNSALIYMQSGSHGEPKSVFLNSQGQGYGKTTSFGQLSPMADRPSAPAMINGPGSLTPMSPSNGDVMTTSDPGSSELQQLRLKLEQKRKEIERKKHRQEAQQNKMRQRLGKAAFMRVVSKHMEEGDETEEVNGDGASKRELSPASSTAAQIQARLGMNPQRQSVSRPQPAVGPGHLAAGPVPPPEASAQRFTDWRSQTQRKAGLLPGQKGAESQSQGVEASGAQTSGSAGSTHAFSRAGIQQTIDNVRNKWFSGGGNDNSSLLVTAGLGDEDQTEEQHGDSFRLHDNNLLAGSRQSPRGSPNRMSTSSPQVVSHSRPHPQESSEVSQLKRAGSVPRQVPPSSAHQPQVRRASDCSGEVYDPRQQEYQEYDSSLDKLNSSLSDLQGEIMRLSLQREQGKANGANGPPPPSQGEPRLSSALSAIGSTASGTVHHYHPQHSGQTRPIHGIPHQAAYMHLDRQPHYEPNQTSVPYTHEPQQGSTEIPLQQGPSSGLSSHQQQQQHSSHNLKQQPHPAQQPPQTQGLDPESTLPPGKEGGFFVSFGEDASPKRAKPKLGEHRSTPTSHMTPHTPSSTPSVRQQQQQGLFVPVTDQVPSPDLDPAVAAVVAGQAVAPLTPASKSDMASEDKGGSPSVGFVIQDQASLAVDPSAEDEMQKKKIRLMEMQRKRREDQERKKAVKEAELARKQEEKMFKEEEQERRKAEERARRDQIFQQYLQKKGDDDVDGPPSSHAQAAAKAKVKRRDRSASNSLGANKQRPKSMFVKAATPEPGALGNSCNSSQEDLVRAAAGGRTTPGVMSAMRTAYNFRMPQQNRMRKAVSCNTLQGPGATHGQATFRRPPSPDLYKLKQQQQQQQRGNSQDSGSDNGSNPGSNPGSEFAGPKLYVKPSAKSNRHIIVNAISHCCLAGSVNTEQKNKVLEEMSKCDANHFLILFRDAGCQYRGLFILYPETEEAVKVCGVGPRHITNKMCEKFYKYNSGGKSFSEIVSKKHLSVSVDAVVLLNSLWKSGKAAVKR